jgi:hypothetical protein
MQSSASNILNRAERLRAERLRDDFPRWNSNAAPHARLIGDIPCCWKILPFKNSPGSA